MKHYATCVIGCVTLCPPRMTGIRLNDVPWPECTGRVIAIRIDDVRSTPEAQIRDV